MKRNEINKDMIWDLSSMFADEAAYDAQYARVEELIVMMQQAQGHIADSKQSFIRFMEQQEELLRLCDNVFVYPHMATDVNPQDSVAQGQLALANAILQKVNVALTFVPLEIIRHQDQIHEYLQDEDCSDFRYPMEEIFRTIPHRLDDQSEALMAQVEELARVPENVFETIRPTFADVVVDGKKEELNDGNYTSFLNNRETQVRRDAYEHYMQQFKEHEHTYAALLCGHAKGQILNARVHKFHSALEASLFEDGVTTALFDKVLYMANDKYHAHIHAYFQLRKDILQLDVQHPYDIRLPLVENIETSYTIDESFAILKQALAPLGEDYVALLDTARDEKWIDYLPCSGKRGGAYSSGTYDSKPFILTNFTGEYESLSTFAHELGHSMHSYFSHQANRPLLGNYTIFVAEVASTVNELLLNEYLMKHSNDDKQKAYLLDNLLMQLVGTIYRQPMYAKFEATLHERLEAGEALSSQEIKSISQELSQAYFGDSVTLDELYSYQCYTIPHYYYNFYVYKYTLGMAVAIAFTRRILNGDVADYRNFLTKGGSESPVDELIHSGVNPCDDNVYDQAFTYFKELLDEFKELML